MGNKMSKIERELQLPDQLPDVPVFNFDSQLVFNIGATSSMIMENVTLQPLSKSIKLTEGDIRPPARVESISSSAPFIFSATIPPASSVGASSQATSHTLPFGSHTTPRKKEKEAVVSSSETGPLKGSGEEKKVIESQDLRPPARVESISSSSPFIFGATIPPASSVGASSQATSHTFPFGSYTTPQKKEKEAVVSSSETGPLKGFGEEKKVTESQELRPPVRVESISSSAPFIFGATIPPASSVGASSHATSHTFPFVSYTTPQKKEKAVVSLSETGPLKGSGEEKKVTESQEIRQDTDKKIKIKIKNKTRRQDATSGFGSSTNPQKKEEEAVVSSSEIGPLKGSGEEKKVTESQELTKRQDATSRVLMFGTVDATRPEAVHKGPSKGQEKKVTESQEPTNATSRVLRFVGPITPPKKEIEAEEGHFEGYGAESHEELTEEALRLATEIEMKGKLPVNDDPNPFPPLPLDSAKIGIGSFMFPKFEDKDNVPYYKDVFSLDSWMRKHKSPDSRWMDTQADVFKLTSETKWSGDRLKRESLAIIQSIVVAVVDHHERFGANGNLMNYRDIKFSQYVACIGGSQAVRFRAELPGKKVFDPNSSELGDLSLDMFEVIKILEEIFQGRKRDCEIEHFFGLLEQYPFQPNSKLFKNQLLCNHPVLWDGKVRSNFLFLLYGTYKSDNQKSRGIFMSVKTMRKEFFNTFSETWINNIPRDTLFYKVLTYSDDVNDKQIDDPGQTEEPETEEPVKYRLGSGIAILRYMMAILQHHLKGRIVTKEMKMEQRYLEICLSNMFPGFIVSVYESMCTYGIFLS